MEIIFHFFGLVIRQHNVFQINMYGEVRAYCHQIFAEHRHVPVFREGCAQFSFYFVDVRVDVVKRGVIGDQLLRGLLSHAAYAGYVVRAVAGKRHVIDHLLRAQSELFLDLSFAVYLEFGDALLVRVYGDVAPDQLVRVLVAGDKHHLDVIRRARVRDRAENVVGLEILLLDLCNAEHRDHVFYFLDLAAQIVGHFLPVCLVVGIELKAKRLFRGIERDHDVVGLLLLDQLEEHSCESENGRCVLPL